jgi:hypothetical protein
MNQYYAAVFYAAVIQATEITPTDKPLKSNPPSCAVRDFSLRNGSNVPIASLAFRRLGDEIAIAY